MGDVPLLSGSRIVLFPARDEDVILRPPPPPSAIVDTAAAVRDALSFPLAGPALSELARPGDRVTIVVEPPELPLPGAQDDPRRAMLGTVIEELSRCGVPDTRQSILVATGLGRRLGRRELEQLLPPSRARAFHGRVLVHDASDPELVPIADPGGRPIRIHPALVAADLVVVASAAESVLHGGPGAFLAACDAVSVRSVAAADSLLRASGTAEWDTALAVETALATKVPVIGISLTLDLPRLTGIYRDYPHEDASLEHVRTSPVRHLYSLLPAGARRSILRRQGRRIATTAAFAGTPSVAHAEALLRGIELRGIRVGEPVDALVVGAPWIGPHVPREPLNPITSAAVPLGLALRLWRDAFPIREGGTLVLVHSLVRSFAHGPNDPYRAMFQSLPFADGESDARRERLASSDERLLDAYRAGRSCHPLLPYADWAGCAPVLARLGRVIVAGSRDAAAARALGFVPSHSVASALEMAHGVEGGQARVGVLLAPPYAPLLIG